MRLWILCLAFCFMWTQTLWSQPSSLEELLIIGARNNPELKAAFHSWKAKIEAITQARSLPNPQITFAQFIQPIETRVGPQRQRIGLTQRFPWFGKLKLKGDVAAEVAEVSRLKFESLKLKLMFEIKKSYFDYYYLKRSISILEEHVRLLVYLEEVLQTRYKVGKVLLSDVLRIQLEKETLEDRLTGVKDRLSPQKAKLNVLVGMTPDAAFAFESRLEIPDIVVDFSKLSGALMAGNPSLKALDHEVKRGRVGQRLARLDALPDFSLGLDYFLTGEALMPDVAGSGTNPMAVKIMLSLPIWSKKNKAAVRGADFLHQTAVLRKAHEENDLLARLESAYARYTTARRKKGLYRESLLPKARQAMAVTQTAFETGRVDFLNYIDSLRTLLTLELNYEMFAVDTATQLAALELLTGLDVMEMRQEEAIDQHD